MTRRSDEHSGQPKRVARVTKNTSFHTPYKVLELVNSGHPAGGEDPSVPTEYDYAANQPAQSSTALWRVHIAFVVSRYDAVVAGVSLHAYLCTTSSGAAIAIVS